MVQKNQRSVIKKSSVDEEAATSKCSILVVRQVKRAQYLFVLPLRRYPISMGPK